MKTTIYVLLLFVCAIPIMAQEPSSATEPPRIAPTAGPYGGGTHGPITYDPSGNIAVVGSDYYIYDPMGRLKTASVNRPDQTGAQVHGYEYDVYGNRIVRDGAAYAASTASNRLTSFGAQYDAAGNLIQWQPPGSAHVRTYTYDALNMLTKETVAGRVVTHVYTADDERLWQFDTTATVSHWTVRDLGGKVLRDFVDGNTGWSLFREYIYRDGQLLAANTAAGTQHYSLDHLGSPRLVTDGAGNKLFQHHYLPFGEEWTIGGGPVDGSTLRFTGHERDDDRQGEPAGTLDYMHARHYSSNLGRFLAVDPVLDVNTALRNPQAWNRYAYGRNQPTVYVDPDGRLAVPWHFGITYVAARRSGMSFRRSVSLAFRAAAVDFRKGSQSADPANANMHAMRGITGDRAQTIAEGRAGTLASIRNSLGAGDVAAALHTVQDAATPLHQDRVWPGSYAGLGLRDAIAHFFADLFPSGLTIATATANSEAVLAGAPVETLPFFSSDPLPTPGAFNDQSTLIMGLRLPGEGAIIDGVWYYATSIP